MSGRTELRKKIARLDEELRSREPAQMGDAIRRLGDTGHRDAIEPLARMLKRLPDEGWTEPTKLELIKALGRIKHPRAVSALAEQLKSREPVLRILAANALGEIGHPSAIEPLVEAMGKLVAASRLAAGTAVAKIGHPDAITPVAKLLQHDNVRPQGTAASVLCSLGRSNQKRRPRNAEEKALQLIWPHLREEDNPFTIKNAFDAALKGKISGTNARLYVKQLRAQHGNVK